MPRRRTSNRPIQKRTITGCQTCRKRKIKCDESKPVCGPCSAKGLQCSKSVNLKWESEYTLKGLAFGRAGKWSKRPNQSPSPTSYLHHQSSNIRFCPIPRILPSNFIQETIDESNFNDWDEVSESCSTVSTCSRVVSSASEATSPWEVDHRAPSLDMVLHVRQPSPYICQGEIVASLLPYFTEKLCPLTVSSKNSTSPLANIILPFSLSESPLALDSVMALAACHMSRSDASYKPRALRLSNKVLTKLRSNLRDDVSGNVVLSQETIVVMMLLCLYEIVSECDGRWVVHLKGARDLIRFRNTKLIKAGTTSSSDDVASFAERFFAFQDVIGRTACGEDPIFGCDFWQNSDSCEEWLGCSQRLVKILCTITDMSHKRRVNRTVAESVEYQQKAAMLETQLETLHQCVERAEDVDLEATAELKRQAAILYLHCALYNATPRTSFVKDSVCAILANVSDRLEAGARNGLIWPLFVAAVEMQPGPIMNKAINKTMTTLSGQAFVLHALDTLADTMTNISRARKVILQIWSSRDSFDGRLMEDQENDWEHFVAPYCGNMSLV